MSLVDLDPNGGGTDLLGMFPLFLKRRADVLVPRLIVEFRRLIHLGSFHACWRQVYLHRLPVLPISDRFP